MKNNFLIKDVLVVDRVIHKFGKREKNLYLFVAVSFMPSELLYNFGRNLATFILIFMLTTFSEKRKLSSVLLMRRARN